ncbi:MAG: S41 family peptidase [Oscillospiraceae bacterium]|nr:S41 family peptidase [Oscillospiraceae bacterium]
MGNKKKIVLTAVITAVVTAVISCKVTSYVKDTVAVFLPSANEDAAFYNKVRGIEQILDSSYLYDYDKNELRETALAEYVNALDEPYTSYYSAEEFSSYIENIRDGYVGIGVIVAVNEDNQIEVVAPFEGSPAYDAGLQPGDIIKAVDGTEYDGNSLNDAVNSIKNGKEGTIVNITLIRGDEELNIDIERGDISSESVNAEMLEDNIGYIRITGFNMESENGEHSTYSEFNEKFYELQNEGMTKLIIDLRDNPGGVLSEVCDIADMLLPEGTITYTEDKYGEREYYSSDAEYEDIPIVILINGNSASASEVLTGALKDYGRATVIGTTSYGKGIVQKVYTFYDGSGISFTTSKYYTPNGICIHEVGIEPDITVEMPEEFENMYASMIDYEDDVQLQKAVEVIKEK